MSQEYSGLHDEVETSELKYFKLPSAWDKNEPSEQIKIEPQYESALEYILSEEEERPTRLAPRLPDVDTKTNMVWWFGSTSVVFEPTKHQITVVDSLTWNRIPNIAIINCDSNVNIVECILFEKKGHMQITSVDFSKTHPKGVLKNVYVVTLKNGNISELGVSGYIPTRSAPRPGHWQIMATLKNQVQGKRTLEKSMMLMWDRHKKEFLLWQREKGIIHRYTMKDSEIEFLLSAIATFDGEFDIYAPQTKWDGGFYHAYIYCTLNLKKKEFHAVTLFKECFYGYIDGAMCYHDYHFRTITGLLPNNEPVYFPVHKMVTNLSSYDGYRGIPFAHILEIGTYKPNSFHSERYFGGSCSALFW